MPIELETERKDITSGKVEPADEENESEKQQMYEGNLKMKMMEMKMADGTATALQAPG